MLAPRFFGRPPGIPEDQRGYFENMFIIIVDTAKMIPYILNKCA
jgi:hypothetical protein